MGISLGAVLRTRGILTICTIALFAGFLVDDSLSYVHDHPFDSRDAPSLDEIMRRIEHTTRWEEIRENFYLKALDMKRSARRKRTPEQLHQKFNNINARSKLFAMIARISENVTRIYGKRQLDMLAPDAMPELCRLAGFNYTFKDCPSSTRLRTFDGACNNLKYVNLGKAFAPFRRDLPPEFADDVSQMRQSVLGGPLPEARVVSSNIIHFEHVFVPGYTSIIAHFGQFLDHDITKSGADARECSEEVCEESSFCMPIMIPDQDPFFQSNCMEFVRSLPSPAPTCVPGPRQQLNQVTSFVDGSQIYGSTKVEADFLRDKDAGRGHLRSLDDPASSENHPLLPLDEEHRDCISERVDQKCGMAGDERAAEQPGLTGLHTMFLRLHNRVADQLAGLNPTWDDERLFQESRRIVTASWQHIVYTEYLPTLLGRSTIITNGLLGNPTARFFGYDVEPDPTVSNVFATAGFRFGHSQVTPNFTRLNEDYEEVFPPLPTGEAFFNATHTFDTTNGGLDSLIRGMTQQLVAKVDGYITIFLTRHLFATPAASAGLDLGALNVQRGRDHGLPGYNAWRQWCGLRRARDFNDLANEFEAGALVKFQNTYSHVDDIDVFVAIISERPMRGALVGPTLACLIGRQFQRLKFGDRFWYETARGEQAFTDSQLQEIRKMTMARVICDQANGMRTIQSLVFRTPDEQPAPPGAETSFFQYNRQHLFPDIDGDLPGFANVRVPCSDEAIIPRMNLEPWREGTEQGKREEELNENLPEPAKKVAWWYRKPGPGNKKELHLKDNLAECQKEHSETP